MCASRGTQPRTRPRPRELRGWWSPGACSCPPAGPCSRSCGRSRTSTRDEDGVTVRGRPALAAIAGFFFLLSLAVELLVFGVLALNSIVVAILLLSGILVGSAWP